MVKSIINNPKLLKKFCQREDAVFSCRKILGCDYRCPLDRLLKCQFLMDEKNLSLGEAHNISLRVRDMEEKSRKIEHDEE